MVSLRRQTLATIACCTSLLLLIPAIASADPAPPPLPQAPGYPPIGLRPPGIVGRPNGYQAFANLNPPGPAPSAFDARGVGVGTNADHGQPVIGMPGSRLSNSPTPGVRTSNDAAAGIQVGVTGEPAGLESPDGQPLLPTPAPGNEAVLAPTRENR